MVAFALPVDPTPASIEEIANRLPASVRAQLDWFPHAFRTSVIDRLCAADRSTWRTVLGDVSCEAVRLIFRLAGATAELLRRGAVDELVAASESSRLRVHEDIRAALESADAIAADELHEAYEWLRAILVALLDSVRHELPGMLDTAMTLPELSDEDVRRELRGPGGSFLRALVLTTAAIDVVTARKTPPMLGEWCDAALLEVQAAANAFRAQGVAVPTLVHVPGVTHEERRARWVKRTTGRLVGSALPPGVMEKLIEICTPEEVWIFGSRARGTHGPHSDWDVLVVVSDSAPDSMLDSVGRWELLRDIRRHHVDVSLVRKSEFAEARHLAGTLSQIVSAEGQRLYGRYLEVKRLLDDVNAKLA